jgi:hypothetical protein
MNKKLKNVLDDYQLTEAMMFLALTSEIGESRQRCAMQATKARMELAANIAAASARMMAQPNADGPQARQAFVTAMSQAKQNVLQQMGEIVNLETQGCNQARDRFLQKMGEQINSLPQELNTRCLQQLGQDLSAKDLGPKIVPFMAEFPVFATANQEPENDPEMVCRLEIVKAQQDYQKAFDEAKAKTVSEIRKLAESPNAQEAEEIGPMVKRALNRFELWMMDAMDACHIARQKTLRRIK